MKTEEAKAAELLSLEFVKKTLAEMELQENVRAQVSPEDVLALLRGFVKAGFERVVQHRAEHLASLYDTLDTCARNVAMLEEAADHPDWVLPPEHVELVTEVYALTTLLMYWGFADNMRVDEEEGLRTRLDALGAAWKGLFDKIARTRPQLADLCAQAARDERTLSRDWSDIFLGEVDPKISPEYCRSYVAFGKDLNSIAEGL